jgi:hypothetical protein
MSTLPKSFKRIVVTEETAVETPQNVEGMHLASINSKFLFAGKSVFTVNNETSGEHFTFKVRARESEWPKGSGKRSTNYFINVKASGGKYPFRYVGLLNADGTIKVTAKSDYTIDDKEYKVGAWASQVIVAGKMIPTNYKIQHAGKCGRCARELTHPDSIKSGIGPECAKFIQ